MRRKSSISYDDDESLFQIVSKTNIEEEYLQKEGAWAIYRLLQGIEEPYKEIFLLRSLGDMSFKEIGYIFNKTESWARVTYHRARIKIQEVMGKE